MKKKASPQDGASVIEREVPTTKIERTIKLTIKGQQFELTFAEANALAESIGNATGSGKEAQIESLKKALERSRDRGIQNPYERPWTSPQPYFGPQSPSIPSFPPGTIICRQ